MADKKVASKNSEAKLTDEVDDQDKDQDTGTDRKTAHPGYKYYRKTHQFGG